MLETSSTSSTSSTVNKIGEAASTSQLTPEEQLHQQQVKAGKDKKLIKTFTTCRFNYLSPSYHLRK